MCICNPQRFSPLLYRSVVRMGGTGPWEDKTVQSSLSSPTPTPAGKATPGFSKGEGLKEGSAAQRECMKLSIINFPLGHSKFSRGPNISRWTQKNPSNVVFCSGKFVYPVSQYVCDGMFKSRKYPRGCKPQIMSTAFNHPSCYRGGSPHSNYTVTTQ